MRSPENPSLIRGSAPIAKVSNPAIATMGGAVLVWIAHQYFKLEIPPEVAIAIIGLIAYAVAYLTPLKRREIKSAALAYAPAQNLEKTDAA